MPHPAVLFSCFCSLCILHLKNIRTGRSILVNDIKKVTFYMANRFLQMINLPLFRLQKNQEAEHLEKKPIPCVII